METLKLWLLGILIVVIIVLSVWWSFSVWSECRAAGHSVIYCMKLVSK